MCAHARTLVQTRVPLSRRQINKLPDVLCNETKLSNQRNEYNYFNTALIASEHKYKNMLLKMSE